MGDRTQKVDQELSYTIPAQDIRREASLKKTN